MGELEETELEARLRLHQQAIHGDMTNRLEQVQQNVADQITALTEMLQAHGIGRGRGRGGRGGRSNMEWGRGGVLRYDGYGFYFEYDPKLYYPACVKKADAEFLKEQNDYQAEQKRIKVAKEKRELERVERWKKLEAKWKAEDELFLIKYGITREEALNGKKPKFNHVDCVVPHTPIDVVHVDHVQFETKTVAAQFVDVVDDRGEDKHVDVHVQSEIFIPHAEHITEGSHDQKAAFLMPIEAHVTTTFVLEQIPEVIQPTISIDIVIDNVEAMVVKNNIGEVQSAGLVAKLKEFQATHIYLDPYLMHCRSLNFVIADLSTIDVPIYCGVLIMCCYVVEWKHGSKIFVFDPGGFEDESFRRGRE